MKLLTTASVAGVLAAASVSAQSTFTYTDFSSVAGLSLVGSTVQVGNNLQITDTVPNQTGNAWHQTRQEVLAGFDTQFEFRITPGPVLAEGMAFVIQNNPGGANLVGGSVWGLAYGPGADGAVINNSIAIEIDTFLDGFLNDTSANEVSVHSGGSGANGENESFSLGRTTPAVNMSDGNVHTMRILYVPGTLEIFVDNLTNPVLTVPWDFQTGGTRLNGVPVSGLNLPVGSAFVGFGATTGANNLNERVEILSWTWASSQGLPDCYLGSVGVAAGGDPIDVLSVDGSTGGFFRTVKVPAYEPFTIDVAAPPSTANAAFLLFGELGISDGSAPVLLPWGEMCFAPAMALDFGVSAPASIPIPSGIPFTGSVTLQGLIQEDPATPGANAVTNAIGIEFLAGLNPSITNLSSTSAPVGQSVNVNGTGFSQAATLTVAGVPVTPFSVSPTQIQFNYPAGVPCDSTLVVTNPNGASDSAPINPTPTVTNALNPQGSAAGGLNFIVIGTGFSFGTTVTIGGAPATVNSVGSSVITMTTPPGTPGPAQVVITTPGGCSATTTYTYL